MLETTVSGLLLAAISALAFIAYRHHDGYRKIIDPFIRYGFGIPFGLIISWLLATYIDANTLESAISIRPDAPIKEYAETVQKIKGYMELSFWTIGATIVATFYFGFLLYLPEILGLKEKDSDGDS